MNLCKFSVHRPIFVSMITLMVIIMGGVAFVRLPIDLMPEITNPTLSISSEYENASPEEMEELVTRPIEEAMSAVPGVEEITSVSSEGVSSVRMAFSWGTDIDAAANDVRDRLDRVMPRLPEDMVRPGLRKFDLASFPILRIGASSRLDPVQLRMFIDDQIKYRIERLPGVASLTISGGLSREIHVNLFADKVKALGLPLDMIISRVHAENVNVPAGTIERGSYEVNIRTPGEYANLDMLRNTVIAIREGVPIQLKEIASVEDAWEKVTQITRVNGVPGMSLSVYKQSGKNTVEVAKYVLEELDRINHDYPQIKLIPTSDTSGYIQKSITNVGDSALYGGLLAILILLFFLRSVRSTVIIATAIPISIIATFALMYFYGFTLNLMTLGGLALGVGMLVDNSVVVLENIFRLRESGYEAEKAAIDGSDEVTDAVIASTVTTIIVFLPLIFVKGMAGIMFKQLSIIVSFSLVCSLVVALTVVPLLAAKTLSLTPHQMSDKRTWQRRLINAIVRFLTSMENKYKELLDYALDHRARVIIVTVLMLAGSLLFIPLIGVEFIPKSDEGEVQVNVEMEVGTRVGIVDDKLSAMLPIIQSAVPEIKNMVTRIGGSSYHVEGTNKGEIRISLVPLAERKRSSTQIAASLRRVLANIPGTIIRTREGQGLFVFRMMSSGMEAVEVEIRGHDMNVADALAARVKNEVEQVKGVTDVVLSREIGSPEELIIIDRQKAADMKLTVSQIANALQTIISGTQASYFHEGGFEYIIRVQLKDADKMAAEEILDLNLTNADGRPVVLRNVVQVNPQTGPVLIERQDQERVILVAANISGRDMGSVIADIGDRLRSVPVPKDFSIGFGGDYEEQQKAFRELFLSIILSLILVYAVMACQYESLRDPFIIMFSVPFAAIGVILLLFLTNTTFNVQTFIGCIMLGGIVVNNAILLVDHTNLLRRRDGMPMIEAVKEAGRRRLRPILMTALATSLGLLPLALGIGEGGETQAGLARSVIGGLMSSTFISLLFIPVIYTLFEGKFRFKRKSLPQE